MLTIKELLEKRAKLIEQAREIYNKAETEKREHTAEERQNFDKLMDEAKSLKEQADKLEADEKRKSDLEIAEADLKESRGRHTTTTRADKSDDGKGQDKIIELRKSVCGDVRQVKIIGERATVDYRRMFQRFLLGGHRALNEVESRALQKDADTGGGYLSAPVAFMAELIQAMDNLLFMRQIGRVLPPLATADSIDAPSLDTDPADPTWTSELSTGDPDTAMGFGKRSLTPHPCAQRIKVSKTLLRRSQIDPDAIVRDRLAYKMGVVLENAYLNGSGNNQPLGIFTRSNDGVAAASDVPDGNTQTEITFDGLINCKYALKPQYRQRASWIFHTDALKMLSKIKDGEGRYIWRESVRVGEPDRLLNLPYYESVYAPNTFETTCYVGILGDFSYYWIVDALTLTIQVLLELYAEANQNGYISRLETDGMPVLTEAFKRVKLA